MNGTETGQDAVQVIQHEPAERKTTLEEARARLDAFMGKIASAN